MKFAITIILMSSLIISCAPTVTLQAPDKPLEINLNVKIDHEIKVKVDKELDNVMSGNEDIF
jgi:hypothetical protein